MKRTFAEAVLNRRTNYTLSDKSALTDKQLKELLGLAMLNCPSPFNMQSARTAMLLGGHHKKLWSIVVETLRGIVPAEAFAATEKKIADSFASGYGTILFFEDQGVIREYKKALPSYADKFPGWSLQASGMLQFAVWTMLEDSGMGASLQHYNPLIDKEITQTWGLDPDWMLVSQMPFGIPAAPPAAQTFLPLEPRMKIFG